MKKKHTPGQWQAAPETTAERDRFLAVNAKLLEACNFAYQALTDPGGAVENAEAIEKLSAAIAKAKP